MHSKFRAIFTSNPDEYAGVHKAQDALKDRLVTIHVGYFDRETEVAITMSRSGIAETDAKRLVDLVRAFRGEQNRVQLPSIRESIKIARILKARGIHPSKRDSFFRKVCLHVLTAQEHVSDARNIHASEPGQLLEGLMERYC